MSNRPAFHTIADEVHEEIALTAIEWLGLCAMAEAYPDFVPADIIQNRVKEMLEQFEGDAAEAAAFWRGKMYTKFH